MSRRQLPQAEILVIDGGSADGTVEFVAGHGMEVLTYRVLPAARLNLGIEQSQGEMLLLHHPRSVIEPDDIELPRTLSVQSADLGGFTHQFDLIIHCCALLPGTPTIFATDLALCILITACFCHAIKQSGIKIPDIDIFEDTELSKLPLGFGRPVRLAAKARTSAIRFRRNGIWRQAVLNQLMKKRITCSCRRIG